MKKHLIILLLILSACNASRRTMTSLSVMHNNSDTISKNPEIDLTKMQNNSFITLGKYNGDTLGYVQHNFLDNKQKYVGKDLNTLLHDVEIPIKSFVRGNSVFHPKECPFIYLEFFTFEQVTSRMNTLHKPVNLIITWSPPLPYDSVDNLWFKHKGRWSEAEIKYFGGKIIGDIQTTNHNQ